MTRRSVLGAFALSFAVVALAVACEPPLDRAIDPAWGKQPCGHCAMLIQDREAAAELVTPKGERVFFDDVGCLVSWIDEKQQQPAHAWVRAPGGGSWVDARATRYASGARTPMDYGFVAAGEGANVISYDEMATRVRQRAEHGAQGAQGAPDARGDRADPKKVP
jgi:hypothetical protein